MVTLGGGAQAEFLIFAPHASCVEILGSFTGWHERPLPMLRGPDGWWIGRTSIAPGDHEFQYQIDGRAWQADYAAHGVRLDRSGAWISRLHVPAAGRGAPALAA